MRTSLQTGKSSLSCNVTRVSNYGYPPHCITILNGPFNIRCAAARRHAAFNLSTAWSRLMFLDYGQHYTNKELAFNSGPLNTSRGETNFGKIWSAWGQYEIEYTAWRMKKHTYNYIHILTVYFRIHHHRYHHHHHHNHHSYDRSITSSKASSPQSVAWCFLFQFPLSSRFLKIVM